MQLFGSTLSVSFKWPQPSKMSPCCNTFGVGFFTASIGSAQVAAVLVRRVSLMIYVARAVALKTLKCGGSFLLFNGA